MPCNTKCGSCGSNGTLASCKYYIKIIINILLIKIYFIYIFILLNEFQKLLGNSCGALLNY